MTSETAANNREIVLTRVIEAPRELVFAAWTEPARFERWFGPRGFSTKVHQMDFRPGGLLRYTMRAPDGTEFSNRQFYREIAAPARLVYLHGSDKDDDRDAFEVTVTFEDLGGRTRLTMRMVLPSEAARANAKSFGAVELGYQTITRLEEDIASAAIARTDDEEFILTRIVNASRDLVWKAYTERERLTQWFGPKGCAITHSALELRTGGFFHFCMRMPYGSEMWARWTFLEIAPPQRLVVLSAFSDADGGLTPSPFPGPWPMEIHSTTEFADLGGRTRITLRWSPHNASAEERAAFKAGHGDMTQGWSGNFDVLDDYLAGTRA